MRHHGLLRSPRREVTCSCPEHHKAPRKCDSVRRRGIVSLPRLLRGTGDACRRLGCKATARHMGATTSNIHTAAATPNRPASSHQPPCRQTSSVLTTPAKWTSLMRPLHSSSRNDPTHPAQSILRRINIRISIIPDEHQGMPWEQHDLIKKRQNADRPGQVISNERTENKNEYLSMPYLDSRQIDKLIHLSSCNIPFVFDKPF